MQKRNRSIIVFLMICLWTTGLLALDPAAPIAGSATCGGDDNDMVYAASYQDISTLQYSWGFVASEFGEDYLGSFWIKEGQVNVLKILYLQPCNSDLPSFWLIEQNTPGTPYVNINNMATSQYWDLMWNYLNWDFIRGRTTGSSADIDGGTDWFYEDVLISFWGEYDYQEYNFERADWYSYFAELI